MAVKPGKRKKTDRRTNLLTVVFVVAVVGGLAWFLTGDEAGDCVVAGPIFADSTDAELVALGRDTYRGNCAACHGVNLEGQPNWRSRLPDGTLPAPPHDKTGHTWHHPDSLLFAITKCGGGYSAPKNFTSAMPAFGDTLSDRQILASLAYIKSRWPAQIRRRQDKASKQNP